MLVRFVIGMTCSGKSHYISQMSDDIPRLNLGDKCREKFGGAEMAKDPNPLTPKISENFVRSEVTKFIGDNYISKKSEVAIDGFPRSIEQFEFLINSYPESFPAGALNFMFDYVHSDKYRRDFRSDGRKDSLTKKRSSREEAENVSKVLAHVVVSESTHNNIHLNYVNGNSGNVDFVKMFDFHEKLNDRAISKFGISTFELVNEVCKKNEADQMTPSLVWARRYLSKMKEECEELEVELPENWWSQDKVNLQRCRVELIDVFHFFLSLSMSLGFTAETFSKAYYQKANVNLRRWSEGYEKRKKSKNDDDHVGRF